MRFAVVLALTLGTISTAAAADVTVFGSAKVKPTYYGNFDFDSSQNDAAALNEAGWAIGEHVRSEIRLGARASGENWSALIIAEADVINEKDSADRSFYATGVAGQNPSTKANWTNFGSEFGIERAEFSYRFVPLLKLATGWNIRDADIATGGMVFGDDHPFIELSGTFSPVVSYQLMYIQIQNRSSAPPPVTREASLLNDWRAYLVKVPFNLGGDGFKVKVSPFAAASDNEQRFARAYYVGAEITGQIGIIKPYFEFAYVTGDYKLDRRGGAQQGVAAPQPVAKDIASMAGFAGIELALNKAFNPYVAFRYTQGDDNAGDSDAEGFVGITDIGRFTGLLGMDGAILGEHLSSGASIYNSPLYSFSPERAVGGNGYGGIGNGGSGNNPGQQLIAIGARGDLGAMVKNFSYKAQAFYILYDKTDNLIKTRSGATTAAWQGGPKVDDVAGTVVSVQLKYDFSKQFAIDYIGSAFVPGDGIKDQLAATAKTTTAQAHTLTMAWAF
jgi:hypothetical protein